MKTLRRCLCQADKTSLHCGPQRPPCIPPAALQKATQEVTHLKTKLTAAQENTIKQEESSKKLTLELNKVKGVSAKGAEDLARLQQQLKEVKDLHIGAANQLNKVQAEKDALEKEKQRLVAAATARDREHFDDKQKMHGHFEQQQQMLERMKTEQRDV